MTFNVFDNVFLLYLSLEASQGVFYRLAFLQSNFRQRNCTPKPVLWDSSVIARHTYKVKHYVGFFADLLPSKLPNESRPFLLKIPGAMQVAPVAVHMRSWLA